MSPSCVRLYIGAGCERHLNSHHKSDAFHKIGWLRGVRNSLIGLAMRMLWENPLEASFPSENILKEKYWEWAAFNAWSNSDSSSMVGIFLETKLTPRLESYWDNITRPRDRKLYFQLRAGSLPLKSLMSRWTPTSDNICPACGSHSETVAHLLFACPAYALPRRVWLAPVCNLLCTFRSAEA